ncbi:MAG: hypothetical protein HQL23_04610 [Candidatus Omnitrophica bacterium]|nr:hypothetical protein [Candidatus Omnitrophota bacterium]
MTFISRKFPPQLQWSLAIVFLIAAILPVFVYTMHIRRPWFGILSKDKHQWSTASTMKFTEYWLRESPAKLKFGLIENPRSVEMPTLQSRVPYQSYPPGTIIGVYIFCRVLHRDPTAALVMSYNLANHLAVTIVLALTVLFFFYFRRENIFLSFLFALLPAAVYLLLPGPLYYHQNVFFSDAAIILPFALILFLELCRDNCRSPKARMVIDVLLTLVFIGGILTDWFILCVAGCLFVKRWVTGEMRGVSLRQTVGRIFLFWLPFFTVIAVFILQLYVLGILGKVKERVGEHTGLFKAKGEFNFTIFFKEKFWPEHIVDYFGHYGPAIIQGMFAALLILLAALLFCRMTRRRVPDAVRQIAGLGSLALFPCYLYTYALKGHAAIHGFTAMKFAIPVCLMLFVLLPYLFFFVLPSELWGRRPHPLTLWVLFLICAALTFVYLKKEHPRYAKMFPAPFPLFETLGKFFRENTLYQDMVFSPDGMIGFNPPQYLAYTGKRMYEFHKIWHIYYMTREIHEPFDIDIMIIDPASVDAELAVFLKQAYVMRQLGPMRLYKIHGQ